MTEQTTSKIIRKLPYANPTFRLMSVSNTNSTNLENADNFVTPNNANPLRGS